YTATGSPTSTPCTPGPVASTQPAFSCPSVNGGPHGSSPGAKSYMRCMSEWQAPAPPIRTRTSPGPGAGCGTSRNSASCFQPVSCNALMSATLTGVDSWSGVATRDEKAADHKSGGGPGTQDGEARPRRKLAADSPYANEGLTRFRGQELGDVVTPRGWKHP